ncbi:MAG: molybdopterin-dependent oxidoreductase, partial [Chloroflexi bacterium]|nr:molybdopterin-dependent oxidoreductase [Chloroflexota bacterium]
MKTRPPGREQVIPTVCASHCGGSCLLKVHVKNGVITRIETDDGDEPQLRACLRGRAYRQRVHAQDRLLYPMKRVGARGEGKFERVSWDEALDRVAGEYKRVRDTYGPASVVLLASAGDVAALHTFGTMSRLLNLAGGHTTCWGAASFHAGVYASIVTYGTFYASNTRDDLVHSKLIIMWGWNPANSVSGTNTCWYLAQAREAGARIVAVDPRHTDTAATFAHQWIPIRPGTDAAMLLAMAYVMIKERLYDEKFINTYVAGFDQFKKYVLGTEDGMPKTPGWAENITGVPAATTEQLAKEYATRKPAALMAGIGPGRTSFGEQYHRAAISLAAMTGNVGIHGGDAAARAWESVMGGYRYSVQPLTAGVERVANPAERGVVSRKDLPYGCKDRRVHSAQLADAILRGKAGGYYADYKLLYLAQCNYVNQFPNTNKIVKALHSLEFIVTQEQFLTPTAKFADIVLPACTFMERNDLAFGVGSGFVGAQNKVIDPLGESKSPLQIAIELAERLGVTNYLDKTEEEFLRGIAQRGGVPDYAELKRKGVYRVPVSEPQVALKKQIEDPANNPFRTPSGKIEVYSQLWADVQIPGLPSIPTYLEAKESRSDPRASRYPLQLITTAFKRRALSQFDNVPWLRELQSQAVAVNSKDAQARGIRDGDMVRVFNDRGEMVIPARVTERIIPGAVDVPHGAWYDPDEKGID